MPPARDGRSSGRAPGQPPPGRPPRRPPGRWAYLPACVGLGLFTGDLVTLGLRGDLTLARTASSAVVAVLAYAATRLLVARFTRGSG